MRKQDLIPSTNEKFNTFQNYLMSKCVQNQMAWGLPQADVQALSAKQAIFAAAWLISQNRKACTPAQSLATREARVIYETLLRPFIQKWIVMNSLITNEERLDMDIKPRDTQRTPIPKPVAIPVVDIQSGVGRSVMINFRTESDVPGKLKRGKPSGVAGIQIRYAIDPAQVPTTPNQCNEVAASTRTIVRIEHEPEDSGKKAYFFCRYFNPRNEGGPWSPVFSFILP